MVISTPGAGAPARWPAPRSVHEHHVAVHAVGDRLAHALAEQPCDQARLLCAEDDQVGAALLRYLGDRLGRVPDPGRVVRLDALSLEIGLGVLELLDVRLGRVGRIDRPRRTTDVGGDRGDARHDQLRIERLGELRATLERSFGGLALVVADEDRLHISLLPTGRPQPWREALNAVLRRSGVSRIPARAASLTAH